MIPNICETKLCNKTNSRTLISNMTIVFSNSTSKRSKLAIFGNQFKDFYFGLNFTIRQNRGCPFQIWQWFFQIPAQNYPNNAFFSPKCKYFLFLHETSHIEKLEDNDFENENSCFQIPAKNTQIRNFLWKLKSFFFLSETLSQLNFIYLVNLILTSKRCYSRINQKTIFKPKMRNNFP